MSADPYDVPVVVTWSGEARFGHARQVIAWLHDDVVPRALASPGCLGADAFAEDGDGHEVLLVTTWATVEDADAWEVGGHRSLRSHDEARWMRLADAQRAIELDR